MLKKALKPTLDMALDEEEMSRRKQQAEDLSNLVDETLPKADALGAQGKIQEALDMLLACEKQTRQAGDVPSTSRIAVHAVSLCFQHKRFPLLGETLVLLSKRRGQLKTAVQKMVQAAAAFVDELGGDEQRALIDTLIEVTDGKIYVEVERARLTRTLAGLLEGQGKIEEAAEALRGVQVETFGAMTKVEKTDYILEQVRLCLDAKDNIRSQILSNKINRKYLTDPDEAVQQLKLRFYRLQVRYQSQEKALLEVARAYQAMYNTPCVMDNEEERNAALKSLALYAVLAPHDNEQCDLLARVAADVMLDEVAPFRALVKFFSTMELMRWQRVLELYTQELAPFPGFESPQGEGWTVLQQRVVEHNVRVVAKYYARIEMSRLAQLLDLSPQQAEDHVAKLVVQGSIYARIDRPTGIINFVGAQSSKDILNGWASSISQLLTTVESTSHLIAKERMVHGVE